VQTQVALDLALLLVSLSCDYFLNLTDKLVEQPEARVLVQCASTAVSVFDPRLEEDELVTNVQPGSQETAHLRPWTPSQIVYVQV